MANEKRLIPLRKRIIYAGDLWQKTFVCDEVAEVRKFIENAPTVDAVEVVHAHWEDGCAIHNGKEVYKSIDCSNCNEIFKTDDRECWKARFKVCPFCGAKMDGDGNEID